MKKLLIILFLTLFFLIPAVVKAACNSVYTLPVNEWHLISLPCDPGANKTVANVLGDDMHGELDIDWAVYKFNASTQHYEALVSTDVLKQGQGYWVVNTNRRAQLDMPASSSSTPVTHPSQCSSRNGCFDIPLQSRQNKEQWNLLGFPFTKKQTWNASQIVTNRSCHSSPCSVTQASSADKNILENKIWKYVAAQERYVIIKNSDKLTEWTGFWAVTLGNAHMEGNPRLLFPSPSTPSTGGGSVGSELIMFDWNTLVKKSHRGFPRDKNIDSSINGDWTGPINYVDGTLYLRAKIKSGGQPVPQTMRLNFCAWQKDLVTGHSVGLEECAPLSQPLVGIAGNELTWSLKVSDLVQISDDPIDWTRIRRAYGLAIKNTARDPVTDFFDPDWSGENPDDWYPLDMRFTVVVVPKGKTFSGWNSYIN
jgi:hypothetical protein